MEGEVLIVAKVGFQKQKPSLAVISALLPIILPTQKIKQGDKLWKE
jgi:hypothetical protein